MPFLIFVAVLLVSMTRYNRRFDKIVSNMTVANNYNLNFKEEMDESLYKLVVGYVDYEEISENGSLKDPYALIGELRGEFTTLRDITTEAESRLWLESLLRNIDTLEKRVDDIMENIRIGGRYDENIEELDNNIYILTELIQDNIQYYIYYQTKSMEAVTTDLNRQIHNFVIACGLLGMVLLVLTVLVTYLITADILRPIKVLYDATQRVSQGDLSARADVASRDEIEILARGFNDMAGNLELLVQRTKEDEQKLRKLDLRLLQEQINPHFLYNTLDTIVWLIEDNKADEAVNMVVTLSNFFRLVLSRGRELISLREEEQHIRSYLEIQEMRYHDILEYDIRIDPALYDYQILKLTLQPPGGERALPRYQVQAGQGIHPRFRGKGRGCAPPVGQGRRGGDGRMRAGTASPRDTAPLPGDGEGVRPRQCQRADSHVLRPRVRDGDSVPKGRGNGCKSDDSGGQRGNGTGRDREKVR